MEKLDRDKRLKSFAVQRNPSQFWVKFWEASERNVVIYDVDVHGFGNSLRRRYKEHAGA